MAWIVNKGKEMHYAGKWYLEGETMPDGWNPDPTWVHYGYVKQSFEVLKKGDKK